MADAAVQTAVYKLAYDTANFEAGQKIIQSGNEQTIGSFEQLEARLNTNIKLEQRRRATIEQILRVAEEEGTAEERVAAAVDMTNRKFEEQAFRAAVAATESSGKMNAAWSSNRGQLLSLQASGINAFQALASGMSLTRVAMTEGAQVIGAFAGFITGPWALAIAGAVAGLGLLISQFDIFGSSADTAAEKQKKFSAELDHASKLMDEINGKAERTRASMFAERSNLIGSQEQVVSNIQAEIIAVQNRPVVGPGGANVARAQISALNKELELQKEALRQLKAVLGEYDEGTKHLGETSGKTADQIAADEAKLLLSREELLKAQERGTRLSAIEKAVNEDLAKIDRTRASAKQPLIDQLTTLEAKIYDQAKANEAATAAEKKHDQQQEEFMRRRIARATELAEAEERAEKAAEGRAQKLIDSQAKIGLSYEREIASNTDLNNALAQGAEAYAIEAKYLEILNRYRAIGLPLVGKEKDQAYALATALVHQEEVTRSLQAANADLDQAMQTLAQSFLDAKDGSIDWAKVTLAGIDAISDAIIKLLQLDTQGNGGLGGLLGGLLGALLGGIGGGVGGGSFSGVPSGFPMAEGGEGIVTKPTMFMAGEKGTEYVKFTPLSHSGKSVNDNMSVVVNNVFDFRNASINKETIQREILKATPAIVDQSVAAVSTRRQRGGHTADV